MKKYLINLVLLCVALCGAIGCAQTLQEPVGDNVFAEGSALATKAFNTPAGSTDDAILVYMDDSENVAEILSGLDIKSFERVMPDNGHDDVLAKYGLNKWYVVYLNDGTPLVSEAERIASCPQVKRLQFNKLLAREVNQMVLPAEATPSTRAVASDVFHHFNDPMFSKQWHFINVGDQLSSPMAVAGADINVKDAWNLTKGDPRVVVAVLDAGVKTNHPDLAANMWTNEKELNGKKDTDNDGNGYKNDVHGYNFVKDTCFISVTDPHGTHVAGTISAVNNNGIGVASIAGGSGKGDGVRIMTCQIIDGEEGGATLQVARAAQYACDNGASIIQGSFGFEPNAITMGDYEFEQTYPVEHAAYMYFMENAHGCDALKGGVIIMSAGNDAASCASYPSAYSSIISVTATAIDGLPSSYTNYGPGCNIAAPGGDITVNTKSAGILSTVPPESQKDGAEYAFMQGTSMACPHVSGIAALGLSYALKIGKTFTADEFKALLLSSVSPLNDKLQGRRFYNGQYYNLEEYRFKMGTGNVDAWRFLTAIDGTPSLQVTANEMCTVDITSVMGGDATSLTYLGVDYSHADGLGVEEAFINNGRLKIKCSKVGNGFITIKAVSGGEIVESDGYGPCPPSGIAFERKVSIISRPQKTSSNGGWL